MPSSRYAFASSSDAASISATMLGVERIFDPAEPMRFAVMSSVTVQVNVYSVGLSIANTSCIIVMTYFYLFINAEAA